MKICFITPRFPYPVTKGDTLRAYHQIRELSRNHTVDLVSLAQGTIAPAALAEMRRLCERVDVVPLRRLRSIGSLATLGPATRTPLQVLYFRSPALGAAVARAVGTRGYDVVHAVTIRVAPAAFANSATVPVVVDFMDSYAANLASRRDLVGPFMRRVYDLELSRVQRYEREVARRAAGGVVVAELDRRTIGFDALNVIPNGVDTAAFPYAEGERDANTLLFTGNMGYGPNVDAVEWFVGRCWPRLRAARPELRFQIVGARPTPAVSALGREPGVEVTGRVPSMVPYLQRATIAVCPIRCGSGMQNKLLEAMSSGAPVVTTEFANRGIGAVGGRDVTLGDDPDDFNRSVLRLLDDPQSRLEQARSAKRWVEATYGWASHAEALCAAYRRAGVAAHSLEDAG